MRLREFMQDTWDLLRLIGGINMGIPIAGDLDATRGCGEELQRRLAGSHDTGAHD